MRGLSTGMVLAGVLAAGCGRGAPGETPVYEGKIRVELTGKRAKQYANMPQITFIAQDATQNSYTGASRGDGTFELTAPPGEYLAVLGTIQVKATIRKGDNTVRVDTDQDQPLLPPESKAR